MSINGLNVRKLRQAVGIGQVELAKRVGVSQGMISQLEVGCRSCRPDTLEILAAELRCSVEDLTGQPAVWVQFMRNCKRLSNAQLAAVNEVVSQLVKCSPADIIEAASTSTNTGVMQCG
jgi:predicted transcriptional regulator